MISSILLIIITIFVPPIGVFIISGCGADLLINICLTILGYSSHPSTAPESFFTDIATNTVISLVTFTPFTSNTFTSRSRSRPPRASTTIAVELLVCTAIMCTLAVSNSSMVPFPLRLPLPFVKSLG
jgi:uncharacterized membrane protein YqaE (UPF0057 family)